jgi:hydroxymethylbilane synthase
VAELLGAVRPDLGVELVPLSTEGDRRTDVPLSVIGGKGVFAKEVQSAVLAGEADLAVHSAKDLPAATPQGLVIAGVPGRGDSRDALVGARLDQLAAGDVVATGSARRRVQLAELVPGIRFAELRGNMATRLSRAGEFAAIVVAAVALERLGLSGRIAEVIQPDVLVPQVGQGTLAVECRTDDAETISALAAVSHPESRRLLDCERAFLAELGGDCDLPAGAHARMLEGAGAWGAGAEGARVELTGVLAAEGTDGPAVRVERLTATGDDAAELGRTVAAQLAARLLL